MGYILAYFSEKYSSDEVKRHLKDLLEEERLWKVQDNIYTSNQTHNEDSISIMTIKRLSDKLRERGISEIGLTIIYQKEIDGSQFMTMTLEDFKTLFIPPDDVRLMTTVIEDHKEDLQYHEFIGFRSEDLELRIMMLLSSYRNLFMEDIYNLLNDTSLRELEDRINHLRMEGNIYQIDDLYYSSH